jgi:hypothetical protein
MHDNKNSDSALKIPEEVLKKESIKKQRKNHPDAAA